MGNAGRERKSLSLGKDIVMRGRKKKTFTVVESWGRYPRNLAEQGDEEGVENLNHTPNKERGTLSPKPV